MKIAPGGLLAIALLLQGGLVRSGYDGNPPIRTSGSSGEDGRNGTLKVYNVTLKRCIRYAYGISEARFSAGPNPSS